MSLTPELYEIIVKIIDERVREIKVTREEFDKLRKILDERFSRLEEATIKFTEAQQKTEERLDKLTKTVNNLAETVNSLVEAQKRNEERFGKLIASLDNLGVEVGRLSDTIGFGLEDICKVVLPGWLYKHLNIKIDKLEREFFIINGERIEVNVYGEGFLNDEKIAVIVESKSKIHENDVNKFYYEVFRKVQQFLNIKCIGVLFGYLIYPEAAELAKELKLYTVASYEK
jgi:seryl-tRNA synthetase